MPIYDYTCKKCNHTFDALVTKSSEVLCPTCGGAELERLVSAPHPPGRSAAIIAKNRAAAEREGHLCNYKRVNGRIVD